MHDVPTFPPPHPRRWRWLLLAPAALVLLLGTEIAHMSTSNFHEVVPGKVYRCSQPDEDDIERLVRTHNIRTVVNLRGVQETAPWYLEESRAASRLDMGHEDISFSAARLPSPQEIRRLEEIFDRGEYPILLHCYRGVDRTGLSSVCARLLLTDDTPEQALWHLSLRFAHLPLGRTQHLLPFFDYYREWLAERGLEHSRARFREWMREGYCPGACRAHLEPLQPRERAVVVPAGEPLAFRVRATNTSIRPWHLSRDPNAGICLCWCVYDPETQMIQGFGRNGLFERVVQVGDSVELTAVLPVLGPGKYLVRVEMEEAQHCKFSMAGSKPVEWQVEVRP